MIWDWPAISLTTEATAVALEPSSSRRRAVDPSAIDDGLEQAVIEIICARIDWARALAIILESGTDVGVQKIGAWNRLREHSERGGIVRLKFLKKFGRRTIRRPKQYALQ